MIRVAVADDHGVLRDGLAGVIAAQPDMDVVATAADGAEAVAMCRSMQLSHTLSVPPRNHFDRGGVHSSTASHGLAQRSASACSAQYPS